MTKEERERKIILIMAKLTSLLGDFDDLEDMPLFVQEVKQKGNMFKAAIEKKLNLITVGMDDSAMEQYTILADGINWCENELEKLLEQHIMVDEKKCPECGSTTLASVTSERYVCVDCKNDFIIKGKLK